MSNVNTFFRKWLNRADPEHHYLVSEETVNYRNIHDAEPPIYTTIRNNKLDQLELLLSDDFDPNKVHDGAYSTPIQVACEVQNLEALRLLVEYGGLLNAEDQEGGVTPIVTAATVGSLDIVRYLLDCGADINARGTQVAPQVASQDCQRAQLDFPEVYDAYHKNTALIQACREGHYHIVQELLTRGCDTNIQNQNGNTALHVACLCRTFYAYPTEQSHFIPSTFFRPPKPKLVDLLLRHGAAANKVNYMSQTPLQRIFQLRSSYHLCMTGWSFSRKENNDILHGAIRTVHCMLQHGTTLKRQFRFHLRPHRDLALAEQILKTVKFAENFGLQEKMYPVILDLLVFSMDNGCVYSLSEICELKCYDPQYEMITDQMEPLVSAPRPLKSLCRQFVRNYVYSTHGAINESILDDLPIPPTLSAYVMGHSHSEHGTTAESSA